jgi:hypothetical protein
MCTFLKFKMHLNFFNEKKCVKCVSYIQSNMVFVHILHKHGCALLMKSKFGDKLGNVMLQLCWIF